MGAGPSWPQREGPPGFRRGPERARHWFVSLTDSIDTTTASGRFFFNVMASLPQMERKLMVERTQAGLQAARQQGRVGGRKRVVTEAKIRSARKLLNQGTPPKEVAASLGVSVPTLYRWVPATNPGAAAVP